MPKAYTGPKRPTLSELLFKHLTSDLADGAVRRGFSSLLNREDKERSGIISSIERDTAWIDSPPMAKVLKGPSLDLKQAALERRQVLHRAAGRLFQDAPCVAAPYGDGVCQGDEAPPAEQIAAQTSGAGGTS